MAIQPTEAPHNPEAQKPDYTNQETSDEQAFEASLQNSIIEGALNLSVMQVVDYYNDAFNNSEQNNYK